MAEPKAELVVSLQNLRDQLRTALQVVESPAVTPSILIQSLSGVGIAQQRYLQALGNIPLREVFPENATHGRAEFIALEGRLKARDRAPSEQEIECALSTYMSGTEPTFGERTKRVLEGFIRHRALLQDAAAIE